MKSSKKKSNHKCASSTSSSPIGFSHQNRYSGNAAARTARATNPPRRGVAAARVCALLVPEGVLLAAADGVVPVVTERVVGSDGVAVVVVGTALVVELPKGEVEVSGTAVNDVGKSVRVVEERLIEKTV
jgi:hypothetical protein